MGQCGCGDYNGRWRIPGPDGKWYVLSVGGGCVDCSTPIGLAIDLYDDQDMQDWDAYELPVIGGPDNCFFGAPIIDIDIFRKEIAKVLEEGGVRPQREYETIADQCSDLDFNDALIGSAHATAEKFDDEIAKAEKKITARK